MATKIMRLPICLRGWGPGGGARKKGHQQKDIDRGLVYNFVILSYGHFKDWKVCSGRQDNMTFFNNQKRLVYSIWSGRVHI